MCMGVHMGVGGQLPGIGSFLLPPGLWCPNPDYQAWWPVSSERAQKHWNECAFEMELLGACRL